MKRTPPHRKFYVYEHWRPDKNKCFYVGKGFDSRAHWFRRKNLHHSNIVAKLARMGMCVEVRMVECGLSEHEAFVLEKVRIAFWRSRGTLLTNQSDGGEGLSNPSGEVRAKMRRPRSPEGKAAIKEGILRNSTPEQRKEIARANGLLSATKTTLEQRREWGLQGAAVMLQNNSREQIAEKSRRAHAQRTEEDKARFRQIMREKRTGHEVTERTRELIRLKIMGRRWVTNGVEERQIEIIGPLEEGWCFGRAAAERKGRH